MTYRAVVNDGRGTAVIWRVRETRTGTVYVESVGTVYGVHNEAEALEAWRGEQGRAIRTETAGRYVDEQHSHRMDEC